MIETIRRLSVAVSRQSDPGAAEELDRLLHSLSPADTVSVMRAFSYFSHLANIAEDRHHVRRRALREAEGAHQEGSLAHSFHRLAQAGIDRERIATALAEAYVSPVLTRTRPRCSARARSTPSATSPACWPSAIRSAHRAISPRTA